VDQLIPNKTLKLAIEAHIEEQSKKKEEPTIESDTEAVEQVEEVIITYVVPKTNNL
jgi:hypothetical protein